MTKTWRDELTESEVGTGAVPVGEGHHDVKSGQCKHEVEHGPGVLDPVPLGVAPALLVLPGLRVGEVDGVCHGNSRGGVIGGRPEQAKVEY